MAKELAPIPGTDTHMTVAEQLRELIAQVPKPAERMPSTAFRRADSRRKGRVRAG